MSSDLTRTESSPVNYNPGQASLLDMRADARRFPRLKSYSREMAVSGMRRIVTQAFLYRGTQADPANIDFIATALVDELLSDTLYGAPNITLAEIQVVVKRAVLGDTEMFGVSVASLYKVIMAYVKGEGHELDKAATAEAKSDRQMPILSAYAGEFINNNRIK